MQGTILEVSVRTLNTAMQGDQLTGATVLNLTTVDQLPAPSGAFQLEDGSIILYTSVDTTNSQVTLTAPTLVDLFEGAILFSSPLVQEKWATVELQSNDDAVFALVPHSLADRIPEGVRDPEGQEYVIISQEQGDWVVVDILGSQPVVDSSSIGLTDGSELALALSDLQAQVAAHTDQIGLNTTDIENVTETATDAGSLASIANVSTTLSDYEPAAGDAVGRREGSLWFTRTRARMNAVWNPSFEVDTSGWTTSQLSTLRELALSISGSYSCKLTNSGVSGPHRLVWDNAGTRQPALPGQSWAASCFAAAVSGVNTGVFIELIWYDGGGSILGATSGVAVNLIVDDYQRLSVIDVAPASTATVALRLTNPTGSETSVWRIDGALLEVSDILGRYFDGRSVDGSWSGVPNASTSILGGAQIVKAFELDDNAWVQKKFSSNALTALDASLIVSGVMDGERIQDYSIPIDKLSATPVVASEALTAGHLVNIHNSTGLFRMRKAKAEPGFQCDGFILADTSSGAVGFFYSFGYNPFVTGLTPGLQFISTVAGTCSSTPPSAVGKIHQRVGVAAGATVLNFTFQPPVKIT